MHARRMGVAVVALCTLFVSVWMLPEAAASEGVRGPKPSAEMTVGTSRVDWQPADYPERLVLTVAGPGDLLLREEFPAGQAPFLSLFRRDGTPLPDGNYTYEIRDREILDSGYLKIQGGSFVTGQSGPRSTARSSINSMTAPYTLSEDLIVEGDACIGESCTAVDGFYPLKLNQELLGILFDDVTGISANHDWAIVINDALGSGEYFAVADAETNNIPFRVEGDAPQHALYVRSNGNVGLGTSTPAARLDVKANAAGQAAGRLQNSSATGYSGTEYLDNAGNVDLFFGVDNSASTTRLNSINNNPIVVLTNSLERMRVTSAGDIGIGTASPAYKLHVSGSSGSTQGLIEETNGTAAIRTMLELKNNGASRLNFTDSSVGNTWGVNNSNGNLNMVKSGTGVLAFSLQGNGNLTITGTLAQGSDRDTKRDFVPVQPEEILAKVANLPISTWNRKTDPSSVRHMGPTAQDFAAVFELGDDDRHIAILDIAGVSLASIQALNQKVSEKEEEIAQLRLENADLARRLAALEALVLKDGREKAEPSPAP